MRYDAEFVELIVREVLRRLRAFDQAVAPSVGEGPPPRPATRELKLAERLVTLATLRGRLDDVVRVAVTRRAVVTPAARDELKQRKIELIRET